MNEQQADALKGLIEASHPDAGVMVEAEVDGARVTISGPGIFPGVPGQGSVVLSLSDNSPYIRWLLAQQIS